MPATSPIDAFEIVTAKEAVKASKKMGGATGLPYPNYDYLAVRQLARAYINRDPDARADLEHTLLWASPDGDNSRSYGYTGLFLSTVLTASTTFEEGVELRLRTTTHHRKRLLIPNFVPTPGLMPRFQSIVSGLGGLAFDKTPMRTIETLSLESRDGTAPMNEHHGDLRPGQPVRAHFQVPEALLKLPDNPQAEA